MSTIAWHPDLPHNDLPVIPPTDHLETRPVLRACIAARAAVAGLNQAARLHPNPAALLSALPVLEAQASSALAGIVTTADLLFENLDTTGTAIDPATAETLCCRQALLDGYRQLARRPLRTRTALQVAGAIKGEEMAFRTGAGRKLAAPATGRTIYTPPVGETTVRDLLADWERFLHEDRDLDPVIRLAAAHAQFVAIAPFTDGNGRTGRVLSSLFLIQEDLLTLPVLPLSRYLLRRREQHDRLLIDLIRNASWEPWLLFMLEAVRDTAHRTLARIEAAGALADLTDAYIREQLPKVHSRELVDVLFCRPYCRIEHLVESGVARRQTASRYLKSLAEAGVLEERKAGRDKLFVNPRLMEVWTDD